MAISDMSREVFGCLLNEHLRPASPVDTIELLQGRDKELRNIEHALYSPGRHVFIYGDRGVGKSSLAQTAAHQYQSADAPVLTIACTAETTFLSAMTNLAKRVRETTAAKRVTHKAELNFRVLRYERTSESEAATAELSIANIDRALELIADIRAVYSEKPIVVLDEFDAIANIEERTTFARFLKMMGDAHIWIPFIFSGIGASLETLLGGHLSSYRQIAAVYLDRLSWNGRWDIFKKAMAAFNIDYHQDIPYRIAGISDGFPYYVHLITEKLLWRLYEDGLKGSRVGLEEYLDAVAEAARSIAPHLKGPYEKATERPSGQDFHYVIWGAAATTDLRRQVPEMYASYGGVDQIRTHLQDYSIGASDRGTFTRRLNNLTKESYGPFAAARQ